MEALCGRQSTTATPEQGIIYSPQGRTVITRWAAGCAQYGVKFDRHALESELESMTGRPVQAPIRFAPVLSVTSEAGQSWFRLVRTLARELHADGGLLYDPLVAAQLSRAVSTGLLLAAEHDHSEEVHRPRPPARPRTIRRAVDAVHAAPDEPHTVAGLLAAVVGGEAAQVPEAPAVRHVGDGRARARRLAHAGARLSSLRGTDSARAIRIEPCVTPPSFAETQVTCGEAGHR